MLLLPILTAALSGSALLVSSFWDHLEERKKQTKKEKRKGKIRTRGLHLYVGFFLLLSAALAMAGAFRGGAREVLFYLADNIPVALCADGIGRVFLTVTSLVFPVVCLYAFRYMEHEGEEKRFYGCYLLVYAVLTALDLSANLITFYFFFEWLTLLSMPLVIGKGGREAVMAALKYLFYSLAGAYLALFGIFFLYRHCESLDFRAGGTLRALTASDQKMLLICVFLLLLGFGVKAGMFPLHAWLPTAHPVAPSPASAVLSGVIVKSGVLAVIRTVYGIVGPQNLRGTWVQTVWCVLTLLTVFLGSLLAFREKVLKKRLAYSTVSQVSYMLFGLSVMSQQAFVGALFQLIAHAFAKSALFLAAGSLILQTGKKRVDEYAGIADTMGITLWGYTFASLSLIGIPPTAGFLAKWFLAQGALDAQLGALSYAGPVILLVSALLTAGYLLPISLRGFFPGKAQRDAALEQKETLAKQKNASRRERIGVMPLCVLALSLATLFIGLFPNGILEALESVCREFF